MRRNFRKKNKDFQRFQLPRLNVRENKNELLGRKSGAEVQKPQLQSFGAVNSHRMEEGVAGVCVCGGGGGGGGAGRKNERNNG